MLDDQNTLRQRDPSDALGVAANEWQLIDFSPVVENPDFEPLSISNIIVSGMGGSALAALIAKSWLDQDLAVPLEVVRDYELPSYVDEHTLVIVSSYSGNTEETLQCLDGALKAKAQLAIMAAGGKLAQAAQANSIAFIRLPNQSQPRMTMLTGFSGILTLLQHFKVVDPAKVSELYSISDWLRQETEQWLPTVPTKENYAKQLAHKMVGKTVIFYGGKFTAPIAYKWKISCNENAKNLAFWNQLPEMSHNEFIGWSSHPIEKPYAVFDLVSTFEHPMILKRFFVTDRLLSGKRPAATTIQLAGDTALKQLAWGCILADFTTVYLGILNGVDPTPVELVESFKKVLVS